MANILFKRGLQSALPKTAQDGVFYLTTDTNRLYVGQSDSSAPVLLNQTVQIVPDVSYLPGKSNNINGTKTTNDFYYCAEENILAVYTGTEWKQINPDHNDNDTIKVTGVTVSNPVANATNNTLTYDVAIGQTKTDKDGKDTTLNNINFDLVLKGSDLEKIIHDQASVGLNVAAVSGGAKISTKGDGADNTSPVILKSGSNIEITTSGENITVSATDTTYTVKTAASGSDALVNLSTTDDDGKETVTSATFKAGTNLSVAANANGITYSHANISTEEDTSTQSKELEAGEVINVVTAIGTSNGHTTKVTTKSYKMPSDTKITEMVDTVEKDWKTNIKQTDGKEFSIDFSKDAAELQSTILSAVDSKISAVNTALTYRGTVSTYDSLSAKTSVKVGDVWMLDSDDGTYEKGDLFIAASENYGSDGIIVGKVEWTYVPSGNELNTDTLFYGAVTMTAASGDTGGSATYTLKSSISGDGDGDSGVPAENEALVIAGGADILIKEGPSGNVEICHKEYTNPTGGTTPDATSDTQFTAITGLEISNGHITAITKENFKPQTVNLKGNATNNTIVLVDQDNGEKEKSIKFTGDNWVTAKVSETGIALSHSGPVSTGATTVGTANNNKTLSSGSTFNVLTGVKYDSNGHVISASSETLTLTLPEDEDTTYSLLIGGSVEADQSVTEATQNPYLILRDQDGTANAIALSSSNNSLNITGTANAVTFGLVWDTF